MKKVLIPMVIFIFIVPSLFALKVEGGLSSRSDILEDGPSCLFDCSINLDDKYRILFIGGSNKTYSLDIEYANGKLFSPLFKLHSNYVYREGGFSSLSSGFILNIDFKGLEAKLTVGATGALNYSQYTDIATFTLFPLYNLDIILNAYKAHFSLSLGNRLPFESDIKSPFSLSFKGEYEVTGKSRVGLMGSISLAEIMMDPYFVVYSRFLRVFFSFEV